MSASFWVFAFRMAVVMPGPSNMRAVRGVSSYKFAYSNDEVISSGSNILLPNPGNTYQLHWRPPTTLICFEALAELNGYKSVWFKNAYGDNRANKTLTARDKFGRHVVAMNTRP